MKLLLINPPSSSTGRQSAQGGNLIPLNLCCLAAYARRASPDLEVRICDAEVLGMSVGQTADEVTSWAPDCIGITTTTGAFDTVISLSRAVRAKTDGCMIVLGGPHVSALPERSLREAAADVVVIGEGEETLVDLLAVCSKEKDLQAVDGIGYINRHGAYCQTAERELIADIDDLPMPARDLVDNDLYQPPPTKRVALGVNTIISTSRGCSFNCGFCSFRCVWRRRVRVRSASSVVAEIHECVNRYEVRSINFCDEFFAAHQERVQEICRRMLAERLTVPWVCSARAERLTEETVAAMRAAGCREISFGIESGSPAMLKRIDKALDLDEARRVIRIVRKAGILTHASYIIGYPGETRETIRETIAFAKELNTDVAVFFVATPLPGSRLYKEALESGYLRDDATWENYAMIGDVAPVMSIPGFTPGELYAMQRRALRQYYLRPGYVFNRLSRLRGWNDIYNLISGARILLGLKNKAVDQ